MSIRKKVDLCDEIINKVKNNIIDNRLIENGDKIVLAVSGGPDSIVMLHVLNELRSIIKENLNITYDLSVAHVNHMIRDESYNEKIYVENISKEMKIPFYYLETDVEKFSKELKMSVETCGRKIRYDFFYDVMKKSNSNKIAVAHNLNDDVETIILNFIRGCAIKGLTGMNFKNNEIIRPLLNIEKEKILQYAKQKELNPCFDSTNELDIYTRNKVRLNLIPLIKKNYNQNIVNNIIRMKNILTQDENFLQEYTNNIINSAIIDKNDKKIIFNYGIILNEHEAIITRTIRSLIEMKLGNLDGIGNIHILDIEKLLKKSIPKKKYIIGNKFTIEILSKTTACIY